MPIAAAVRKGQVPLLTLPPPDHVRLLHPIGRQGITTAAVWRNEHWDERVVRLEDLPAYAKAVAGTLDTYISQQSFFAWRLITQLAQLGAAYSDLDYYNKTAYAGRDPEEITMAILLHLEEHDIPAPSYILSTGRGLCCVWLHDLVPRGALPRWKAMQRHLYDVLKPFGPDPQAVDAARVFRLSGTVNSKTGMAVRPTFMGDVSYRWSFDDLANEILPFTREELVIIGAERAKRRAERKGKETFRPAQTLTAATYWESVLSDLQSLRRVRWFGDLPPGHRDCWLFLACNAMSWLAPPFAMQRESYALATEVGGWSTRECKQRMASVFKRAQMAADGVMIDWRGKKVDARYRFKADTIIQWLQIEPAEMREGNLRVLIDEGVRKERDRERWHQENRAEARKEQRRAKGTVDRETYEATAHQKAEDILRILDRLGSAKAVAEALGITYEVAKKRIQRARRK